MKKKITGILIGTIILLFVLWAGVISGKNVSFVNITSEFTFPEENVITGEKTAQTREGRTLRSGRHVMNLRLSGNGRLTVQLSSKNSATIDPGEFDIHLEKQNEPVLQQIIFDAFTEVDSLLVTIKGTEDTDITIDSVEISVSPANDRRFTMTFLILGASICLLMVTSGKIIPGSAGNGPSADPDCLFCQCSLF